MNDIIGIKIVFGTGITLGIIIILLVAFLLYYKYLIIDKKCNKKTTGIVKHYTFATRGGENSSIFLPVVHYTVDNKEYKVVGPEYKGYKIINITSPLSDNRVIECKEDENGYLIIKRTNNSVIKFSKNPIEELYPIGTELDVYYCETNPKISFVLRNIGNNKLKFWLCFLSAIFMMIIDVYTIFILK